MYFSVKALFLTYISKKIFYVILDMIYTKFIMSMLLIGTLLKG